MRYIGNKLKLLDSIYSVIEKNNIEKGTFCDIFSGTTNVAKFFKHKGFKLISNDFMTYSYVFQRAYIQNNTEPKFRGLKNLISKPNLLKVITYLNFLKGKKGFIFNNYCLDGTVDSEYQRNYFSAENAKKIDAIRDKIEVWHASKLIRDDEFYILLAALLEVIPSVSNIAGTYGAFLKKNDQRMFKPIILAMPRIIKSKIRNNCYQEDANKLIRKISCDVLYIDPPYNERQYATNYHILESIAVWDKQLSDNKTGLRPYQHQKSKYCYAGTCIQSFKDLIDHAKCKYILMSYNTDGIIPHKDILKILRKRGKLNMYAKSYRRYKSNSNHDPSKNNVQELLFFVRVQN
jgi:adenine-specific DNA-methyltransferase